MKQKKEKNKPEKQNTLMLGYLCIATEIAASLPRKVEILDRFGLEDSDIARICGSKVQSVRDARQRIKKK